MGRTQGTLGFQGTQFENHLANTPRVAKEIVSSLP